MSDNIVVVKEVNTIVVRADGILPPTGGGDMTSAVYDPTAKVADSFDMANMDESATNKVLTSTERAEIAANTSKISYTDAAAVGLNTAKVGITPTQASEITANNAKVGVTNEEENTINTVTAGEPTGSDLVLNVVSLTQIEYDAGTPVATTLYVITT